MGAGHGDVELRVEDVLRRACAVAFSQKEGREAFQDILKIAAPRRLTGQSPNESQVQVSPNGKDSSTKVDVDRLLRLGAGRFACLQKVLKTSTYLDRQGVANGADDPYVFGPQSMHRLGRRRLRLHGAVEIWPTENISSKKRVIFPDS